MDTQTSNYQREVIVQINNHKIPLSFTTQVLFTFVESNSLSIINKTGRYRVKVELNHKNETKSFDKGYHKIVDGSFTSCYIPGRYKIEFFDTYHESSTYHFFEVVPYGIKQQDYQVLVTSVQEYFTNMNQHEYYHKEGLYKELISNVESIQRQVEMLKTKVKKKIISTTKKQKFLGKQNARTIKELGKKNLMGREEYSNASKEVVLHEVNQSLHYLLHLWLPKTKDEPITRSLNELRDVVKEVPFSTNLSLLQQYPYYRELYHSYQQQDQISYVRKPVSKNTSTLFELYVLLLCVHFFEKKGYSLLTSLLDFENTFTKHHKGTICLTKGNNHINIFYEHDYINAREGFVNLGNQGAKPDLLVAYYEEDTLLYANVIEVKCRRKENILQGKILEPTILNQCANYALLGYYQNSILIKGIIKNVVILYPYHKIESNTHFYNAITTQSILIESIKDSRMLPILEQIL